MSDVIVTGGGKRYVPEEYLVLANHNTRRRAEQVATKDAEIAALKLERDQFAIQLSETEKRLNAAQCEAMELRAQLAHYRWRPISEIHEDHGDCVLRDLQYPTDLELGSVLDSGFDASLWTHFPEVPKLTTEEAETLREQIPPASKEGA